MRIFAIALCAVALAACGGSTPPRNGNGTSGSSGSEGTGVSTGNSGGSTGYSGGASSGGYGSTGTSGDLGGASSGGTGNSGMPAGAKRIFVTSTEYIGSSLTGAAGADQRCNLSAQAQNLGGTWKALISDSSRSAFSDIKDVGPWYLLNGTKVFNNKAGLTTTPLQPIDITEQDNDLEDFDAPVWTGTETGGTLGDACGNWKNATAEGIVGNAGGVSSWLDDGEDTCGASAHLYCIEQ